MAWPSDDTWPAHPPNLYHDEAQPVSNQLGPRGGRSSMVNAQGLRLATYFWPADTQQPKAVVQLLHGNGAYVMEFLQTQGPRKPLQYKGSWIQKLNQAGIAVAGHDMQSCGFSDGLLGLRNFFESFDDIVADAVQFRRSIPETEVACFKGAPVFPVGISMGGHLSIQLMRRHPELYKASVLLAPMVSLEKVSQAGLNPYLMPLSKLVSWLFPHWQVAKVNRNPLYPELQTEWDEDVLNFQGNTRARTAAEYLRVTKELLPNLKTLSFPYICVHGEDDTLCDPDGSQQLYDESVSADKELVKMPKMWHVLIKEPGNEKIIARIREWILERAC